MRVIIGVDDSPFSEDAVDFVRKASWPKETTFLVLSAAGPMSLGPGEALSPETVAAMFDAAERHHREVAQRAATRLRQAGLHVEGRMEIGDPRIMLEDAARRERADLIVVGSHGRSGLKRLLLGSVASHIVTHAPCAVLVVKSPHLARTATKVKKTRGKRVARLAPVV